MKKHNLRKDARLLVEHILNKDPLAANEVFKKLITEAEDNREADVFEELNLDEGEDGGTEDIEELELGDGAEVASIDGLDNAAADEAADDAIEINCQINAKIITNLFDKVAELKNQLANMGLDENSREYLKYDVSIQYYSDKLQALQGKTNPGVDQSEVEEALNKITTSIEQLEGELGGSMTEDITDIASPEEVAADNELSDTEADDTEAETDGDETTAAEPESEAETEESANEELESEPESDKDFNEL